MEIEFEVSYGLDIKSPTKESGERYIETLEKIFKENKEEIYAINEMFKKNERDEE